MTAETAAPASFNPRDYLVVDHFESGPVNPVHPDLMFGTRYQRMEAADRLATSLTPEEPTLVMPEGGLDVPEAVPAATGLQRVVGAMRRVIGPRPDKIHHAAAYRRYAAQANLSTIGLADMPEDTLHPTSGAQERHAVRQNTRIDAVNKRRNHHRVTLDIYSHMLREGGQSVGEHRAGELLGDKDALKANLKNGHYTRAQRKAIGAAGRQFRKGHRSTERIVSRVEKAAGGHDTAGKIARARAGDSRLAA